MQEQRHRGVRLHVLVSFHFSSLASCALRRAFFASALSELRTRRVTTNSFKWVAPQSVTRRCRIEACLRNALCGTLSGSSGKRAEGHYSLFGMLDAP
jgi:hypothetical protein